MVHPLSSTLSLHCSAFNYSSITLNTIINEASKKAYKMSLDTTMYNHKDPSDVGTGQPVSVSQFSDSLMKKGNSDLVGTGWRLKRQIESQLGGWLWIFVISSSINTVRFLSKFSSCSSGLIFVSLIAQPLFTPRTLHTSYNGNHRLFVRATRAVGLLQPCIAEHRTLARQHLIFSGCLCYRACQSLVGELSARRS